MNVERALTLLREPYLSEKSVGPNVGFPQYAFKVCKDTSKPQILKAVELLFKVKVRSVRIVSVHGKQKRFKQRLGQRASWKKAYVMLQAGESIDFESLEKA